MNQSFENVEIISDEFLNELGVFENFLNKIGFKRIEGAVYGLLVLSKRPLSSDEIEKTLKLSQSATSLAVKKLSEFGAVESVYDRQKRCQTHTAKEDSIGIVATVFRKREQQFIEDFKFMAKRCLKRCDQEGESLHSSRVLKLKSIVITCEIAESVMDFVINVSQMDQFNQYEKISSKLKLGLSVITSGHSAINNMSEVGLGILSKFKDKWNEERIQ